MLQEIGGNKTKAGKLREIKEKYFHKGITFLKNMWRWHSLLTKKRDFFVI